MYRANCSLPTPVSPQQQDRRVQGGHLLGPGQHLQRAGIGRHHAGDKPLVALQELHFGAAALSLS